MIIKNKKTNYKQLKKDFISWYGKKHPEYNSESLNQLGNDAIFILKNKNPDTIIDYWDLQNIILHSKSPKADLIELLCKSYVDYNMEKLNNSKKIAEESCAAYRSALTNLFSYL